ncbi:MAG: TatD family hydrolase [Thermoguttaceae bacterium]|nr:TatD family hydrolase [Thermoguttaceae bacterium]
MSAPVRFLPLVDTHAHLNLDAFAADLDDVVARSRSGRFPEIRGRRVEDALFRPFVAAAVCPAVDLETSLRSLELSRRFDVLFAAVGIHPNHAALAEPGDWEAIERLALAAVDGDVKADAANANSANSATDTTDANSGVSSPLDGAKLVAVGETGLDRYWDDAPFDVQSALFLKHLELGRRTGLPVLIHSRDANDDLDAVLRDFYADAAPADASAPSNSPNFPNSPKSTSPPPSPGVVHSFSGTPEQALAWTELGFYLGFGGFVTYPNRKFAEIAEAARVAPLDRILLETDAPFLTPHPLRGKLERNEPLTTAFVAKRIAELRGLSVADVVRQTTENAARLFRFPTLPTEPTEPTLV